MLCKTIAIDVVLTICLENLLQIGALSRSVRPVHNTSGPNKHNTRLHQEDSRPGSWRSQHLPRQQTRVHKRPAEPDAELEHLQKPNIVWVLADDLHYEPGVLENMPNLRKMREDGLEFPNHVSQSPLCGPSRASLVVGRFPHNSGYKTNAADESIAMFSKLHDNSVGKWLTNAGYYTAFLGKYVNGMIDLQSQTPKGWNFFGGFTGQWDPYKKQWIGGTYTFYNTSQWMLTYDEKGMRLDTEETPSYPIKIWTGTHQADFLASQTLDHAKKGMDMGKPFFIFTNPAMIHHGYCEGPFDDKSQYAAEDPWREEFEVSPPSSISPCVKKERSAQLVEKYDGLWKMHAHTSAWNKTAVGQKQPLKIDCCTDFHAERMKYGLENRTASMADLDEMIGVILHGLTEMNVLDKTYVIFTSDNGFHLGEHKFFYGKERPYETDLRVPLVIRTPRGNSRGVRYLPTTHVDITRTIVDIAGAKNTAPLAELDGKSFADALRDDVPVSEWRSWSFSEMFEDRNKTWRSIRFVNDNGQAEWTLSLWCFGFVELFHVAEDADQLLNVLHPTAGAEANQRGNEILEQWLPVINGMGKCSGSTCNLQAEVREDLEGKDTSELMVCEDNGRRVVDRGAGEVLISSRHANHLGRRADAFHGVH